MFRKIQILGQMRELDDSTLLRVVLAVVVFTSLGSLILGEATASSMSSGFVEWLEAWLLDFSTDLASGGVIIIFLRMMLRNRVIEGEETIEPTYFVEAAEFPLVEQTSWPPPENKPTVSQEISNVSEESVIIPEFDPAVILAAAVVELKRATTPEARQAILNQVLAQNVSLEGANFVDLNLEQAVLLNYHLQGVDLTKTRLRLANLQGADLRKAILYMTQLIEADLQRADLSEAVLERTYVSGAKMMRARLVKTRIRTSLWGVNLEMADLHEANLSGAELFRTNLRDANLEGVRLADTKINTDTILPDGTYWNIKVDIARFTDPHHPEFWRSSNPLSPAYREDGSG